MRQHRVVLALGATMLVGLLAGCSAASNGSSSTSGGVAASPALPNAAQAAPHSGGSGASGQSGSGQSGTSGSAGAAASLPTATSGRQVIRTATVSMTSRNVSDTVNSAAQVATGAGGYLSAENADGDSASVTLSVPQAGFDSVLVALAKIGNVTSQQEQSQDVTSQLVDVASRIATQQASVNRVRQLLAQASSISDIVQIEGELTTRESDLESMERQQAELTGQVALSTVTVQISKAPPSTVAATGPAPGFTNGVSGGWHALGQTVRVVLLVLGAALPFLLGIGIPVLVVLWVLRRRRRGQVGPPADTTATTAG